MSLLAHRYLALVVVVHALAQLANLGCASLSLRCQRSRSLAALQARFNQGSIRIMLLDVGSLDHSASRASRFWSNKAVQVAAATSGKEVSEWARCVMLDSARSH